MGLRLLLASLAPALVLLLGCGRAPVYQPSVAERCKGDRLCMVIGEQVEADEAREQVQQQPQVIYRQAPAVYQQPSVALPYANPMGFQLQRGIGPNTYYLPGRPMFTVQPLP